MLFYDLRSKRASINFKFKLYYVRSTFTEEIRIKKKSVPLPKLRTRPSKNNASSKILYRTLLWVEEETYFVELDPSIVLVKDGDFIAKNFEIMPGTFSKTSGLVSIELNENVIQTITIKSGLVYEGNILSPFSKRLYFPGEVIFSNVNILTPSLCEYILKESSDQLLIRPIHLYEFAFPKTRLTLFKNYESNEKCLDFKSDLLCHYSSNQKIRGNSSFDLANEILELNLYQSLQNKLSIELINNRAQKTIEFKSYKVLNLNNYINPKLKYKNLSSCLLIKKNQFVDQYTKLVYIETVTDKILEIVKIKTNVNDIKSILLISNKDCIKIEKNQFSDKKINDYIIDSDFMDYVGKIIFENSKFFILQKGRPYFFPNCQVDTLNRQTNLEYKIIPTNYNQSNNEVSQNVYLNNFNKFTFSFEKVPNPKNIIKYWSKNKKFKLKAKFSKMFLIKHIISK